MLFTSEGLFDIFGDAGDLKNLLITTTENLKLKRIAKNYDFIIREYIKKEARGIYIEFSAAPNPPEQPINYSGYIEFNPDLKGIPFAYRLTENEFFGYENESTKRIIYKISDLSTFKKFIILISDKVKTIRIVCHKNGQDFLNTQLDLSSGKESFELVSMAPGQGAIILSNKTAGSRKGSHKLSKKTIKQLKTLGYL